MVPNFTKFYPTHRTDISLQKWSFSPQISSSRNYDSSLCNKHEIYILEAKQSISVIPSQSYIGAIKLDIKRWAQKLSRFLGGLPWTTVPRLPIWFSIVSRLELYLLLSCVFSCSR